MILVSLPERPDWILPDERIGSDQYKALAKRLRHQQSVKRIAMQQRQLTRKDGILLGDREALDLVELTHPGYVFLWGKAQSQFLECDLETDLPA